MADEHQRRLRDASNELGHEPRLTDARLSGDEHGRRALVGNGRLPALLESRQLGAAADEAGARDASGHGAQFGPASFGIAAGFGRVHVVTQSRAPEREPFGGPGRSRPSAPSGGDRDAGAD